MSKNIIQIVKGDITTLYVDAIVNAANESLLGGGGVDGAIHLAAGPGLLSECKKIPGGCPTGDARITNAYNLRAKFIIHTVGPVWKGGEENEEELLSQCYRRSLGLLVGNNLKSIAFPAISTGVYKFPIDRAAEIAIGTTAVFLKDEVRVERVIFSCFSDDSYHAHEKALLKF